MRALRGVAGTCGVHEPSSSSDLGPLLRRGAGTAHTHSNRLLKHVERAAVDLDQRRHVSMRVAKQGRNAVASSLEGVELSIVPVKESIPVESSFIPSIEAPLAELVAYAGTTNETERLLLREHAEQAARELKTVLADAVNAKCSGLRALQMSVTNSGALSSLVYIAQCGERVGYESLQILCYRNAIVCQQIVEEGIGETVHRGRGGERGENCFYPHLAC